MIAPSRRGQALEFAIRAGLSRGGGDTAAACVKGDGNGGFGGLHGDGDNVVLRGVILRCHGVGHRIGEVLRRAGGRADGGIVADRDRWGQVGHSRAGRHGDGDCVVILIDDRIAHLIGNGERRDLLGAALLGGGCFQTNLTTCIFLQRPCGIFDGEFLEISVADCVVTARCDNGSISGSSLHALDLDAVGERGGHKGLFAGDEINTVRDLGAAADGEVLPGV